MNVKVILAGGLLFYVVTFALSMLSGPILHEGLLKEAYAANAVFWRPELNQNPPNIAALFPYWVTTGMLLSFVVAAMYSFARSAFPGQAWKKGLVFGFGLGVFSAANYVSMHGFFNLPFMIWAVWSVESVVYYSLGGVVLGIVAEKLDPAT